MTPCFYYKIGFYVEVENQREDHISASIFSNRKRKDRYIDRIVKGLSIKYTENPNMIKAVNDDDIVIYTIHTKTVYFYTDKFYDDVPETILFYVCKDNNDNYTNVIIGADSYDNLMAGLFRQKIIDINLDEADEIRNNIISGNFDDYMEFIE